MTSCGMMKASEAVLRSALREANHRQTPSVLEKRGIAIGDVIGEGAFSCVKVCACVCAWQKAHNLNGNTVAVKIIPKNGSSSNVVLKFMPRELEIIRTLKHKNVIICFEFIETTMRFYIVMQYAEKGSLLQLLKRERWLSEPRAWHYFHQLIDGVAYIHKCEIAHRDIKCENIVFDARDTLKLIDFGFARRVTRRTEGSENDGVVGPCLSKTFCGSHAYASPEILNFTPYDPFPSDVWACGVVLFAMVSGKLPFTNAKKVSLLLQIIKSGPKYPEYVSDKLRILLDQIFSPVSKRVTIPGIQASGWFLTQPGDASLAKDTDKTAETPRKRFKPNNETANKKNEA
ncbi:testis-specific serine/threonine-protein kinase 3-like isoform X1 [Anopheles bellator]|uniref:testis-specific serine/threonine-protein kinase 3-like isoform X1 n=1 Tax=Anopheles bellator TaxID=139047 RepID=UPI00264753AE|nr:testis-specific serine/threonine-protein kinase 3-like isoform X1 [Anopheles bellator]